MRLARVLGAIGRGLISAGVIVLLFVAYQLWGTGLQHAAAQGDLGNEFEESTGIETETSDAESLAELALASQQDIEAGQIIASEPEVVLDTEELEANAESGASSDPDAEAAAIQESAADLLVANFDEEERQAILAKLYPDPGEAFARIVIPDINVDQISVEGVSVEDLRKGPGHYRSTPNPGQAGNSAIAGHRTTYGAPFHRVDELDPGDSIFVTTVQGVFHYKVVGYDETGRQGGDLGYFIVSPSDTWVLDQTEGENTLTLTACHPKYSARQRIIVRAELVGEPAPTIPREEAGDFGPVTIDSGSSDERASEAEGAEAEVPEEERVIIDDDVAAADDPDVDADGNPIDADEAADDSANDDSANDGTGDDPVMRDGDGDASGDNAPDEASDGSTDNAAESEPAADAEAADAVDAAGAEEDVELDTDSGDFALASQEASPFNVGEQDFGEGLNGDPTKVRPAIMWGVAGLFIWITAWFMGKRLDRKWTLYAMGLVPFGLVLWSAFVNIDQALPSY